MKNGKYLAFVASVALALSACSSDTDDSAQSGASGSKKTGSADTVQVTTSIYPVSYLVSEIGGDRVAINDLTPPGGDAHGLELSPREIADMEKSDALFYISHLSASMDEAAETVNIEQIVDLSASADLKSPEELGVDPHAHDHDDDHEGHDHEGDDEAHADDHEGHDHEGDDEAHADEHEGHDHEGDDVAHADEHEGHDHGGVDPHFWTDPTRLALVVPTIVDTLSEIDPEGAELYAAEGKRVANELDELATEFSDSLSSERCETQTFVITHEAFAYLADANGLSQVGLSGIDPDTEPSPARIREVAELMEDAHSSTIFATSDSERAGAEALAAETDSTVEVLNPVASQPEDGDYLSAMKDNLARLEAAMGCQ